MSGGFMLNVFSSLSLAIAINRWRAPATKYIVALAEQSNGIDCAARRGAGCFAGFSFYLEFPGRIESMKWPHKVRLFGWPPRSLCNYHASIGASNGPAIGKWHASCLFGYGHVRPMNRSWTLAHASTHRRSKWQGRLVNVGVITRKV